MEPYTLNSKQAFNRVVMKFCWYALYVKPHHEKKVYQQLQLEKIEAYLPLQTTIKQWSDRKKKVTEPLFSCYLFVYITNKEYNTVLNIPGVLRYISFEGKAVAIPEKQIQLIKSILEQDISTRKVDEPIQTGARVEIMAGPLKGIIGELFEFANKKRVILRIKEINETLMINVPLNFLRVLR